MSACWWFRHLTCTQNISVYFNVKSDKHVRLHGKQLWTTMNMTHQRWRSDRICEPWLKKRKQTAGEMWKKKVRQRDDKERKTKKSQMNRIIKTLWWIKDKCLILSKSETLTGVHRWQGFKKRWQEEIRLLVQSSGSHHLHIIVHHELLCLLTFQTAARTDSWDRKHTVEKSDIPEEHML